MTAAAHIAVIPERTALALKMIGERKTIKNVIASVASAWGVMPDDLTGTKRGPFYGVPRNVAMVLCRVVTGRDMSTVSAALNRPREAVVYAMAKFGSVVDTVIV